MTYEQYKTPYGEQQIWELHGNGASSTTPTNKDKETKNASKSYTGNQAPNSSTSDRVKQAQTNEGNQHSAQNDEKNTNPNLEKAILRNKLVVHFKDKSKIRNKKRWSQVFVISTGGTGHGTLLWACVFLHMSFFFQRAAVA